MQVRTDIRQLFCLVLAATPTLIHLQNEMKQKPYVKTVLPPHALRCKTSAVQICRVLSKLVLQDAETGLAQGNTLEVQKESIIWA